MFEKAAKVISESIDELRRQIAQIHQQIAQLEKARASLVGRTRGPGRPPKAGRRKKRGPGRPPKAGSKKTTTKKAKRNLSAAARKALSARMKARWAAFRAEKAAKQ